MVNFRLHTPSMRVTTAANQSEYNVFLENGAHCTVRV
uniref:Uncharacterized protein n=1 Tax=Manihot esculenta TaxID=3983 RepID=A0A2C9WBW6_MANES